MRRSMLGILQPHHSGSNPAFPRKRADSIHRYARIFGGGSVKLVEDDRGMRLFLMETRDRQLMLDQFSDFLSWTQDRRPRLSS